MPETLRNAGLLSETTPAQAADAAITACAANAHVALLQLGALTPEWADAMDTQCADSTISDADGTCDAYAPKQLPETRSKSDTAGEGEKAEKGEGPVARCPFQAVNITDQELQPAKVACGE